MIKRKTFIINKLRFHFNEPAKEVYDILTSTPYSSEKGFGFKEVVSTNNEVSAIAIKRSSTFITEYNTISNEFEKKQIFLFSEIRFVINLSLNIICVFGSATSINSLKSIFRNLISYKAYDISSIDLTAFQIYSLIRKKKIQHEILDIVVEKFSYKNGIVGKYSAKVVKQKVGEELIQKYKTNVIKLLLKVKQPKMDEFILAVSDNGSVGLIGDEDEFDDSLLFFLKLLT